MKARSKAERKVFIEVLEREYLEQKKKGLMVPVGIGSWQSIEVRTMGLETELA